MKTAMLAALALAVTAMLLNVAPAETAGALLAVAAVAVPDLATVGFGHSPKAYAKGSIPPQPVLANHVFSIDTDGQLVHFIDGHERARVPESGMRDYAELWPDCRPLVRAVLGSGRAPGASSRPGGASAARKGPKAKTRA